MYKFYLIWNKGSVNLIPEELNYIYFHDSVPRKQLSYLGSTLPLCRLAQIPKPALNLLLTSRFSIFLSYISLWLKRWVWTQGTETSNSSKDNVS